ncbi:hypothetical protein Tco_0972540 [Tanacetum coccineum]
MGEGGGEVIELLEVLECRSKNLNFAANARRNNEKALNILLSAIPDRHLLSFHDAVDARSLWKAIKARFGGNEASKKMQKNLIYATTHDDDGPAEIDEDAMRRNWTFDGKWLMKRKDKEVYEEEGRSMTSSQEWDYL